MNFEVQYALAELERRTPSFLQAEIFAHGDLKAREMALQALRNLGSKRRTSRLLRAMLKIT